MTGFNPIFFGVLPFFFTDFDLLSLWCQLGKMYQSDFLLAASAPAPICLFLHQLQRSIFCSIVSLQLSVISYQLSLSTHPSQTKICVGQKIHLILELDSCSGKVLSLTLIMLIMCIIRHSSSLIISLTRHSSTLIMSIIQHSSTLIMCIIRHSSILIVSIIRHSSTLIMSII